MLKSHWWVLSIHTISFVWGLGVAHSALAEVPVDKLSHWTEETLLLRGANVFQRTTTICASEWCPSAKPVHFTALRSAGANLVCLSVPGPFNVRTPYARNDLFLGQLKERVKWAGEAGLWTVIAIRTGPGRGEGDIVRDDINLPDRELFESKEVQDHYLKMWKVVAREFRDQPHVVGYDVLVEPHAVRDSPSVKQAFQVQWRELAIRIVGSIRDVDQVTPILICPDNWAAPESLQTWSPLFAPAAESKMRIVYSIHQYQPHDYTHDKKLFDPAYSRLNEAFDQIRAFRTRHPQCTVAITEFGVKYCRPHSREFLSQELKLLGDTKLSHAIWIWELGDHADDCRDGAMGINDPDASHLMEPVGRVWNEMNQSFPPRPNP